MPTNRAFCDFFLTAGRCRLERFDTRDLSVMAWVVFARFLDERLYPCPAVLVRGFVTTTYVPTRPAGGSPSVVISISCIEAANPLPTPDEIFDGRGVLLALGSRKSKISAIPLRDAPDRRSTERTSRSPDSENLRTIIGDFVIGHSSSDDDAF